MASTYSHLVVLLAMLVVAPAVRPDPLWVPASAGGQRESQFDRFRRGFSTTNSDHANQFDSSADMASYDRASATGAVTESMTIGAGADPFGAGAGSGGTNSKSLIDEFDRGARMSSHSRAVDQYGRQASSALDSGVLHKSVASEALIGGPVAGAGSTYQGLLQGRQQKVADADHISQHMAEDGLISEQFDRGVSRKDAASAASIGERLGAPYGAAFANQGVQTATFDESRHRGMNAAKRSVIADRNANTMNEAYNKQLAAKIGANDVVLAGPAEASAGRSVAAEHLGSSQGALRHADSEERRVVNAQNARLLDNTWASGSQEAQVGLSDNIAGEISSGQQASHLVNGYDRIAETGVANSAARKAASSTMRTFDDRDVDLAHKNDALIGGFV